MHAIKCSITLQQKRLLAIAIALLLATTADAQSGFELIRSFGFPDGMGDSPSAGVIEGANGNLFGTTIYGGAKGSGTVYTIHPDGSGYKAIHHFEGNSTDGVQPVAALARRSAVLYGTTATGGSANGGVAFKLNEDGSGYTILHHFGSTPNDGKNIQAGVLIDNDGILYGATRMGGLLDTGTLFKMNSDGSNYSLIYEFLGGSDGSQPRGTLIEISNRLYGTTSKAGDSIHGTIFAINKDGSDFAVLHSFAGSPTDGSDSWAGLLQASDGALYGTTRAGGSANQGIIFKINPNGAGYEVIHHFGVDGDAQEPWAGLLEGPDGKLYGTVDHGGPHLNGVVFRLNKDGSNYQPIHAFEGGIGEGYGPQGALIRASDGLLYGTTRDGGNDNVGVVFKLQPDGAGFAMLRSYSGCGGDGMRSSSRLHPSTDGYLYGTTLDGGAFEFGLIFKMRPDGSDYRVLHDFDFNSGDAINPYEGLIEDADGILYGATRYGGGVDAGTVFKLNKDGSGYTIIHRFSKTLGTGTWPTAGVILGSDGKLYGRTLTGGKTDGATIFRLNRDGSDFTILYDSPIAGGNRYYVYSDLIEATDGKLYGNSSDDGEHTAGTIFSLHKDGSNYTVLHHFNTTGGDGAYPEGGVIEATDGKLYGTTSYGGNFDSGALFRINKDGTDYSILHHFNTASHEAYYPVGNLLEGPGGALFGISYFGGADDSGAIYMINRTGAGFTILHSFIDAQHHGQNPNATLIRGLDGGIYGSAVYGGEYGCGSIFRIAPIKLAVTKEATGFRMHITGPIGQRYSIERADATLTAWLEIGTAENTTGTADFLDTTASPTQQFYRTRLILP